MEFSNLIIAGIKELLIENGYIIIPDWGAFLCTKKTAYLNKEKNSIEPPTYDILFNPNLKKNDGILITYLINKTGIPLYELNKILQESVKEWNQKILVNKKLILKDFGVLQLEGKNYYFEPFKNLIFPEYYGLRPISLNKFLSEEQIIFHILPNVPYNFFKLIVFIPLIFGLLLSPLKINNPLKKFSFVNLNIAENKKERRQIKKLSFIRQKIDSVFDLNKVLISDNNISDTINKDSIVTNLIIEKEADTLKNKRVNNELADKIIINDKQNKYFIVIGSFKSMEEANYYYNLKIKKYNLLKIIKTEKNIRVAIGPFNTSDEVNKLIVEYKNKYPDFIGWILNY